MSFLLIKAGEDAVVPESERESLLQPPAANAPAPVQHDTRISMGDAAAQTAALSSEGPSSLTDTSDAAVSAGGSAVAVEPGGDGDGDQTSREVDTRLHEAARAQDLVALRALLAAGASPNALDQEGRTPLHVCVVERLLEPFKELLGVPDSANVRDARGWPVLNFALVQGWDDGARAALDAGARVDSYAKYVNVVGTYCSPTNCCCPLIEASLTSLDFATPNGDMFETILDCAKRDGVLNSLNGVGCTALNVAIRRSSLLAIKALLKRGACPHTVSKNNESALHVAVHNPYILEYILENTDVISSPNSYGKAPLHEAVQTKNLESFRLLLDKFKNPRVKTVGEGLTPLHLAAISGFNKAAKIILEVDLGAMKETDNKGNTPLHAAAKHSNSGLVLMLLQKGDCLSNKNKDGVTVLELISNNFYGAPKFLNLVFDRFIYNTNDADDGAVFVDYRVLTNGESLSQINVLEEFVRCGQSKALIHPLIESLIYLQWTHFLPLFYVIIFVYAVFLASFNSLMVSSFYYEDKKNISLNSTSTLYASPTSGGETAASRGLDGGVYWLLILLTYISIFILLLQESFFIYQRRLRYFASVESWVKLSCIMLCTAAPLAALAQGSWPRHVACAALLLAWLQAMFLVSRFPHWGYYVLMFGKVIVNMLKILVTAVFLVIGFAFCFMIQFRSAAPFDGPFSAFVKTLVMMSSEFDYEDLFGEDHDEQLRDTRIVVLILFLMFVIFVAIVLMNFMIGVAVSDINDLNETGNIRRLEKQIELLSTLDTLVYNEILVKWFKNNCLDTLVCKRLIAKRFQNNIDRRYHEMMYAFKGNKSKWFVMCRNYPYTKTSGILQYITQIHFSTLVRSIVETASKNIKNAEKNDSDSIYKCKIDTSDDAIADLIVTTEDEEDNQKENDSIWLRKALKRQNKQIKTLVDDLSKVSHENEEIKRTVENLNAKISQMSSEIIASLKEVMSKDAIGSKH